MNNKQIVKKLQEVSSLVESAGNVVSAIDEFNHDRAIILVANCAVLSTLHDALIKLAELQEGLTDANRKS